ncbi:RNB domain-containing ribonuclease [Novimethylophilus kurashikiensis]|uniref:RNB domain-containing ribonuclease n=1 Tax=Novimethylophilus kurashikiensis TaxID=1825523 RepID=UPI0015E7F7F8|nr:ribonuclease R family protein [Novimethylophilus kurashikiensis]
MTTAEGDAFYIPSDLVRPLLSGDEIRFVPAPVNPEADGREVKAVVSVRREAFLLLGEVKKEADGAWYLRSDEPCFTRLFLQEHDVRAHGVDDGDVVAVEISAYEGQPVSRPLEVEIERVLGDRNRDGFAQDYALVKHGFQSTFTESVMAEAEALQAEAGGEPIGHCDLPFVTIDGESTRDFDDAVYAEAIEGGWDVRVAIADVSYYVRPGSALDAWAAERCTSVYLPGRTVPMLPEALSTDRCSLTPGDVKRAVILQCKLSEAGEVSEARIERALIQSAARLTYNEVASYMADEGQRFAAPVEKNLDALVDVYRVLLKQRDEAGKLDFDEPEPNLEKLPDGGWKLVWESRTEAHKLVEELMLLANRVTAEMLLDRYGAAVLRHQPAPEAEDWHDLRTWALTQDVELPDAPSMKSLAGFLAAQPDADSLAAASHRIRSCMRPAKYVVLDREQAGGHFSLSFDWYTHFTSPIRRYADLLVHRLLLAPAGYELNAAEMTDLERRVAKCSERSQAARLAERGVWDGLKLQNFTAEVPTATSLKARVVRITPRGLRVVIQGWQCAAWLPAGSLRANGFKLEESTWYGPGRNGQVVPLEEGYPMQVSWTRVVRERPAYPELNVALVKAGDRLAA